MYVYIHMYMLTHIYIYTFVYDGMRPGNMSHTCTIVPIRLACLLHLADHFFDGAQPSGVVAVCGC